MILRLAWTPKYLAEEASTCSTIQAAFAGVVALVSMTLFPFSAAFGSIDEPYRDLGVYVSKSVFATPFAFVFLVIAWSFVIFAVSILFTSWNHTRRAEMMLRIILLSPVTLLIPGIIWSVFASLSVFAEPGNNFTAPAGKPAWLTSIPIAVFGSCFWTIAGLVWLVFVCRSARRQIGRFLDPLECRRCGYNLTGNVSGVCPECGSKV